MLGSKTLFLVYLAVFSTIALGSSSPNIDRSRSIRRVGLRGNIPEKIDAVGTSEIDNDHYLEDHEAPERRLNDSTTTDKESNSLVSEEESNHRRTRVIGKKKKRNPKFTRKPGALKLWKKTKKLRKNQYGEWINGNNSDSDDSEDLPHGTHPPHTPDPNAIPELFPPTETPGEVPITPNPTAFIPPPPNLQPTSLPPGFTPPPNYNPPPGFGGPPEDFFPPGFGEPPGEEPTVRPKEYESVTTPPTDLILLREEETVAPGPEDFFTPGFGEPPGEEPTVPPEEYESVTMPPPTDFTLPPNDGGDAMLSPDPVILFSKANDSETYEGQSQEGEQEQQEEPDQSSIRKKKQSTDNSRASPDDLSSDHENIFNRGRWARPPPASNQNKD